MRARQKRAFALFADAMVILCGSYLLFALMGRNLALPRDIWLEAVLPAPLLIIPALKFAGVYDVMMRFWSSSQLTRVIAGTALGMAGLSVLHMATQSFGGLWSQLVLQGVVIFLSLASLRFVAGAILRPNRSGGIRAEKVLVYGAGRAGSQLAVALLATGEYQPVAFIDDREDIVGRLISGLRVHSPSAMAGLKERLHYTRVLLAMPSASVRRRTEIVRTLEPLAVKVMVVPSLDDLASGRMSVSQLRDVEVEDLLSRDPVTPDYQLMDAYVKGKSVMITGAGGSIGSELARQILTRSAKSLVLYEISEISLYKIDLELRNLVRDHGLQVEIVPVLADVLDEHSLLSAMRRHGVQTVYHAAAYKHVPMVEANLATAVRNNILGTQSVARAVVAADVRNFVLISSDKAVRPTSVMGATKRVQELIAQAMADDHPEIRVSMVRFGNVLGSSGSVVPLFRAQIQKGGPVTVTDPEVTRYFMTIPEAAQLVIQAGALGGRGDLFVLDMGEPVRISDLARKMVHLSGLSVRDAQNPTGDIDIVYSGLRPGEKLYEELLIDAQATPTTHPRIRRARESFLKSDKLAELLSQLASVIAHDNGRQVYAVLKQLVSGYAPRTAAQVVNISDIRSTRAHSAAVDPQASPPESPAMSPN